MAQGAAVVTSRGTSTEEVAGGAAVLVDPFDVDDIARGLVEADARRHELAAPARARAGALTWEQSARATVDVYRELCR
jgi:glycosyltransferase involved in cell wall biosynthesis